MAVAAADKATAQGVPTDVFVINGFPLADDFFSGIAARYERVLTLEDGLIGTPSSGPRGFAALAAGALQGSGVVLQHFGIVDPSVAPSEEFMKLWEHFGMTEPHLLRALVER
jgi:hypothetical protein